MSNTTTRHPQTETAVLQLAQIVSCTEAEGPGRRFAIWFQGCPLRCPGCCNPEMLAFEGGSAASVADLLSQIEAARKGSSIEGVTLIGGEPFAHAGGAAVLAKAVRERGLTVMIFSGFTIEQLRVNPDPEVAALLAETDLLVDGPYLEQQPETTRRWIGSTNQRVHFLSEAYSEDDPHWDETNTMEIRLTDGEISVNGFPSAAAIDFWRAE
jgi:anaerobic ribonucleoside-triphosphate reductase activating protein